MPVGKSIYKSFHLLSYSQHRRIAPAYFGLPRSFVEKHKRSRNHIMVVRLGLFLPRGIGGRVESSRGLLRIFAETPPS